MEHVARVNTLYIPAIKAAIADKPNAAAASDQPLTTAGWFSAFFLKSVSPQAKAKLRSPRIARPASPVAPEEAVRKLLGTHQEIREILVYSHADLNRLRFKNPFVPLLRFTVGTGILIMATHWPPPPTSGGASLPHTRYPKPVIPTPIIASTFVPCG